MNSTPLAAWSASFTLAQESGPVAGEAPFIPGAPGGPAPGDTALQTPPAGTPGVPPAGGSSPLDGLIWILIPVMLVFLLTSALSGRKERKRRAELLGSIKRNDRVQTLGGIIGSVVEVTPTEVVLRVEESSNTRIRFARTAIQQVLREGKGPAGADVEAKPATEKTPA